MQHLQSNSLLRGGTYKIEKVLGQGSFGITYLAEHTALGKKVAKSYPVDNGITYNRTCCITMTDRLSKDHS